MADENNQESIVSHLNADTDSSAVAIHHTLGPLPFQASPGSHVHDGKDSHKIDYNSLLNLPDIGGGAAEYTSTVKHEVKLGAAIAKGQAVYVSSADGTNMIVSKASNASEATSSKTMGLLESGGSTNAKVNVITEGLLAGLDTSAATAGNPVWLGTDGNLLYGLANKPVAPAHLVFIGIVTRANNSNGEIFVRPQNGFEFDELHDVLIVSPAAGEVIQRTASNLWENKTLAEANIAAADHNHTGVYAPATHMHDDRYYTETEITSLLSGKSDTGHSHVIADVDGLATVLSDKADEVHTHAISDVTGLQASLDDKALAEGYTADRVIVSNGAGAIAVSPTITTTELGYLNGVTDNIQTQLNDKAADSGYTASRVIISDATGNLVVSPLISTTELDYLDNLTDNVQSQLNGKSATGHTHIIAEVTGLSSALSDKASLTHTHAISDVTGLQAELDEKALAEGYTVNRVIVSNGAGAISASTTIDTTELGYLNGVTDNIQTQLDGKLDEAPTEIGNAVNLNSYTSTGLFIQSSNAEAAAGSNYPAPYAGLLEVYARSDAAFVYQRYTTYQPYNIVYHRSNYTGTWSTWKGVSSIGHSHSIAEVDGLATSLADKADEVHTHAISDVTGLQTALDGKIDGTFPTGNRVMVTDATGVATISGTIDTTELGYLNGVTSSIQTQLNAKAVAGSNGVPFAMAANRTTAASGSALAANAQETATTVTFPTSRFSVVPAVTANTSSPRYVVAVGSVATTGFTMTVRNVSDATGTTYTWNWMAIQMTSGAVSG
jgi:hypothetical protein